jgi:hypothetical protein
MSDRVFLSLMAALCVGMIALAAVWPQGLGARSPWPFGQTPLQQTPQMRAMIEREAARAQARHQAHTDAAADQMRRVGQAPSVAPAASAASAPHAAPSPAPRPAP